MFKPYYGTCACCGEKGLVVTKSRGMIASCDFNFKQERKEGKKKKGKSRIVKINENYYRESYENSNKKCEECGLPLPEYSAIWVSHILSRNDFPELRDHPLNHNILCGEHHSQWESPLLRKTMRIYPKNKETILKLLKASQEKYKIKKL